MATIVTTTPPPGTTFFLVIGQPFTTNIIVDVSVGGVPFTVNLDGVTFNGPNLPGPGATLDIPLVTFPFDNFNITYNGNVPDTPGVFNRSFLTSITSASGPGGSPVINPNDMTFNFNFNINVTCVDRDTNVLMADGSNKKINLIKRGDLVAANAANPSNTKNYRVARVEITKLNAETMIDICEIGPNAIKHGTPSEKIIITSLHPIVDEDTKMRRHPSKYINYPGVIRKNIQAGNILTSGSDKYELYDLQFETVGSYVANGLIIQSRNPKSFMTPLAKELYFDKSLYDNQLTDDNDTENEYPLDYTLLNGPN
jgi:hypothetical protein